LFHDGENPIKKLKLPSTGSDGALWGGSGKEHRELRLFADALSRMSEPNRKLLFAIAGRMANQVKKDRR
jgi:hypothetical protein